MSISVIEWLNKVAKFKVEDADTISAILYEQGYEDVDNLRRIATVLDDKKAVFVELNSYDIKPGYCMKIIEFLFFVLLDEWFNKFDFEDKIKTIELLNSKGYYCLEDLLDNRPKSAEELQEWGVSKLSSQIIFDDLSSEPVREWVISRFGYNYKIISILQSKQYYMTHHLIISRPTKDMLIKWGLSDSEANKIVMSFFSNNGKLITNISVLNNVNIEEGANLTIKGCSVYGSKFLLGKKY